MLGSEEMTEPCSDQLSCRGSSPLLTMQTTWANSPSSMVSFPKVIGRISGGSAIKTVRQIFLDQQIKSQWYFVWFVSLFVFLNSASYPWLSSPLTFSSTLSDLDPAEFEAVQVYLPL